MAKTLKVRDRDGHYAERRLPASRVTSESRCQSMGVKPARFARRAASFERTVRLRAQLIAYEWADVDNSVVGAVDDFLRALDRLEESLKEAVQLLREPYDDDQDAGE